MSERYASDIPDWTGDAPDPDELVRWATRYGHPEGWAKKAQQLHGQNEQLRRNLEALEMREKHARAAADEWRHKAVKYDAEKAYALYEAKHLRTALLTVVQQIESCCSRSGLCIDADRVRAEAQRPMDISEKRIDALLESI